MPKEARIVVVNTWREENAILSGNVRSATQFRCVTCSRLYFARLGVIKQIKTIAKNRGDLVSLQCIKCSGTNGKPATAVAAEGTQESEGYVGDDYELFGSTLEGKGTP